MPLPTGNSLNTHQYEETPASIAAPPSAAVKRQKWPLIQSIGAPLRVRDFCLLFGGQMVSTLGDQFYIVALPWLLLTNSGNTQELGTVLAAYGVARLATLLLGGALSDRIRPRRVMLIADLMRMLLTGILALLTFHGPPPLWQLSALSILLGGSTGLFLPASFAIMPDVLSSDSVQAGNALNSASAQFASLIGPGIGGVIVGALQSWAAFLLDAISFVVSALTLTLMRSTPSRASHGAPVANDVPLGEVTDTTNATDALATTTDDLTFWQLLRTSRLLQVVLAVGTIGNLTAGGMLEVALPALAHTTLAAGASGYGIMLAGFGAGAMIGGIGAGGLGRLPHRGMTALLLGILQAVAFAVLPFTRGLAGSVLLLVVAGVTNGLGNIFFITMLQRQLPRHLLGRIMGVLMFCVFGLYPLSVAGAGVVVGHFGPVIIFPASGLAMVFAIAFGLSQRELRSL